jgi:hypothetical protein
MFTLITPKGTIAQAEAPGIAERNPTDLLHYHDDGEIKCQVCGQVTGPNHHWTDRDYAFDNHPNRCGDRPQEQPLDMKVDLK